MMAILPLLKDFAATEEFEICCSATPGRPDI